MIIKRGKAKGARKRSGNLHSQIERNIGERILGGEYPPGALLPNEAEWGLVFGTSRTAVREAVKSLNAKGLLKSRPKVGSRVEPKARWNLLDRDVLDWYHAAMDRKAFLLATQEARRLIEPGIAELAARKRTPFQLERMVKAFNTMTTARNHQEIIAADIEFHEALMAAANNELLVPLGTIIEKALANLFEFTTEHNPAYGMALKLHENILRAIVANEPKAARDAMVALLKDTDRIIDKAPKGKRRR